MILHLVNFQGILCIGALKRARQKKEVSRDQAVKDLEVKCITLNSLHTIGCTGGHFLHNTNELLGNRMH